MRAITILLLAIAFALPLVAQENGEAQRANPYIDHVLLGVKDLESGMADFETKTGVKPRKDGKDADLGTESAIVGLGDNLFLEIIAPDPDADPDSLDPELRGLVFDRLEILDELTPFRWAIGTSNLERTTKYMRRASSHSSDIMSGSRKRGWGREEAWRWVKVDTPRSLITPFFVQWNDETKRPQERAPQGCTLDVLHVNSRNFKTMLNLVATMQIDVELEGADQDSLSYELSCPKGEITFEHVNLAVFFDTKGKIRKNITN